MNTLQIQYLSFTLCKFFVKKKVHENVITTQIITCVQIMIFFTNFLVTKILKVITQKKMRLLVILGQEEYLKKFQNLKNVS